MRKLLLQARVLELEGFLAAAGFGREGFADGADGGVAAAEALGGAGGADGGHGVLLACHVGIGCREFWGWYAYAAVEVCMGRRRRWFGCLLDFVTAREGA